MNRFRSHLVWMAILCVGPTVSGAEPPLRERIDQVNVWQQLARDGDAKFFMVAQPSSTETARARELGVPPTSFDAAEVALGRPITFTSNDETGGANLLGSGLLRKRVSNGALAFEVGARDALLAWGDYDGRHPEFGTKPFGVAYEWRRNNKWHASSFLTSEPFGIYLRVRQSRKESTWRITTGPNRELNEVKPNAAPGGYEAEFKVVGTEWQTVPVIFNDKVRSPDGKPAHFKPFGGFAIHPGDPGNEVEIAWVRVTDPRNHVYARRTFELTAPAVDARISLGMWDAEVYVDGKLAAERWPLYSSMGTREVDLTPFLDKPGRHVLAIHALNSYAEVMVSGGVRAADGTYAPLFSWLPYKLDDKKRWTPDPNAAHFSLGSSLVEPWKTATLAFSQEDEDRFMLPAFDDRDWGCLAPLSTTGRASIGPPYFGLIAVDLPPPEKVISRNAAREVPRKHPIFSVREPVRFGVAALRTEREMPNYALQYLLIEKQSGKTLEQGVLPLDAAQRHVFRREGLPIGPYELRLTLIKQGRQVDERAYEFLVVGPIDQPVVSGDDILDGLKLKTVVDIDCSAEPPMGEYGAFRGWAGKGAPYAARVATAPFGKFRETGPESADCFSYKVRIANPGRPHLLEVTYPDDRLRVHGFFYTEPREFGGLQVGANRCSVAAISGWPNEPTNTLKTVHGLFWPVKEVGTVDVYTTRYSPEYPAANAAAARIRILEIEGEVPRFDVKDFPGQFKPIGVHTERGSYVMWPTYYGGRNDAGDASFATLHERPDFYADWYSVTSNFTRGLRFHGLNFYFAGQHMYGGTNFPSRYNANDNGSGGSVIQSQKDWGGILASVLGENGCGFASSFEYINNAVIVDGGVPSPGQLARGAPTLLAVSESGRPYPHTAGITSLTPLPSWAHPRVQKMFLDEIDEVIELYREYPGWKGISLLVHTLCGPSYATISEDPLKIGYEDAAAERFERDTGIKIPVAADDPARFTKRYAWVTSDPKNRDAWVQWRCDMLLSLYRQVRDRIQRVRPDCRLYLDISYPFAHQGEGKMDNARTPEMLRKYIMQWGWDLEAYRKEPGMTVSTMVGANAEKIAVTTGKPENAPLARGRALEPNYLRLFSGEGRGGVHLYNIFTENWPLAEKGKWLWSGNGAWVGYHWATGDGFNDYWTNTLARVHPSVVMFNWHDSNLDNRLESGLRRFTRAWRPLPNGHYEPLAGRGLDMNIVVQRCREKPEYAYLANPCTWSAMTALRFSAGARVTDLNSNRAAELTSDGAWKLELAPYELRSFRVEGGELIGAETSVDPGTAAKLAERVAIEAKLAETTGDELLRKLVSGLKTALDRGDFRIVEEMLRGGYEYHLVRQKAVAGK